MFQLCSVPKNERSCNFKGKSEMQLEMGRQLTGRYGGLKGGNITPLVLILAKKYKNIFFFN